jgi:D-beta-D-heptose 7-phosphate kinase/D-beta-D-heptose 1-phosphate adenosyltransferase
MKILLIGDSCWDEYVFVENTRKNPENDSPLLSEIGHNKVGGMAHNVHRCIRNLGLNVTTIVPQYDQLSTKTRFIDNKSGHCYFRVDKDIRAEAIKIKEQNISLYDCIVVSDYDKGFITHETLEFIEATFTGPKFLDSKKTNLSGLSKFFIKINEHEAIAAGNIPDNTVVTFGASGAYLKQWHSDVHFPALKVDCVDVCGAGDAFLAGYVYGILNNSGLHTSIISGVVNSGISVTRKGTYAPTLDELNVGLTHYAEQINKV